ncbi:MAG: ATP-binding cassette domain-containing protein [Alphaproteobacteria bacterium]
MKSGVFPIERSRQSLPAVDQPASAAVSTSRSAPLLPLLTRGLTLERDGRRLIDGIDLSLEAGGLTVVMGPNGAGKSLLLRLLHGLIRPTAGEINWAGASMTPSTRKRQGMVFQRPVLLRRSVAANLDFALGLRGGGSVERRDALLERVGLEHQAGQPARLLSGGEQQRLALIRALALEPEVLFLDEPTASLDPASVLTIEDVVQGCRQNGTKIIFVTHDLNQAKRLADDVVFLHRGRLVEQAPAGAFFTNPRSEPAGAYLEGRIVL